MKIASLHFKSENKLLLRFDFLKRVAHVKVKNVFQIDLGLHIPKPIDYHPRPLRIFSRNLFLL